MKKSILFCLCMLFFITASCQNQDFNKVINANQGINTTFVKFPDGTTQTTGKPQMIYPGVGIAVSTGTAWGTSIVDNSPNWNTAFSWGPHLGLYEPKLDNPSVNGYVLSSTTTGVRSWIPMSSGSGMIYPPTGIPLSTGNGWSTISIANNSSNWNTAYSWGNHAGLYRLVTWTPTWNDITEKPLTFIPSAHTHDYTNDITNKPPEQSLTDAIKSRPYLPIPRHTTTYINSIVMPPDESGIVFDVTVGSYKVWLNDLNIWATVILNN